MESIFGQPIWFTINNPPDHQAGKAPICDTVFTIVFCQQYSQTHPHFMRKTQFHILVCRVTTTSHIPDRTVFA